MVSLLAKLLIKDAENTSSPSVRKAYGTLCGLIGIGLNLLLSAGKFLAGFLGHSIAITADAFNNLSDAGSSIITLAGFRIAGHQPDSDHPFGHGRVEYISGLLVSVAILLMALELIKSSFEKILHPQPLSCSPLILAILLASILVKCYMAYMNRKIGEKIHSAAMKATAIDSLSDCAATTAVLISTLVGSYTRFQIDGFCGVLVGLFIGYAGIRAARDTVSPLLGQAPDPEFVARVEEIVLSSPLILGFHDLLVHNYGPERTMLSLHAEVPADQDLLTLHEAIDDVEHELLKNLHCHAVIHMDPVLVGDEETGRVKKMVQDYLAGIDGQITLHDFHLVKCTAHTNIFFDIAVPYHFPFSEEELTERISAYIQQIQPDYRAVIEIDRK